MAQGICDICGFHDDSFRIDEGGSVLKVCKLCHDGYLERMGIAPDADKPIKDVTASLDLGEIEEQGLDLEGLSGEELLALKLELDERKEKTKVKTLDSSQLDSLLTGTEEDKKVIGNVRSKEQRRKKKNISAGLDDSGEDYQASEELIRSGEELQRAVMGLDDVESVEDEEMVAAPLIAKIVSSPQISHPKPSGEESQIEELLREFLKIPDETLEKRLGGDAEKTREATEKPPEPERESEKKEEAQESLREDYTEEKETETNKESDMNSKKTDAAEMPREEAESRAERARAKIIESAHQTIDDERIRITSPEVALSRDKRPKTNLDVATSENTGTVRFLDAFKYVLHRVSYTVLVALIVLAVSTVLFIIDGWQHGLIALGAGCGAIGAGFLLMWYMMHCYELDRRAQLLRIRQQEILFASMKSECYRELRTKFTVIKALGWLLNKLTVLLPLVVFVGGNVSGVILTFMLKDLFWLYPVVSVAASVAGVLVYYLTKFAADCVAYMLDRERNQQVQQQTLLDILDELRKK